MLLILSLLNRNNPEVLEVNPYGVVLNGLTLFEYTGKKVSLRIKGVMFQGSWIGCSDFRSTSWGYGGPVSVIGQKFPTKEELMKFEFGRFERAHSHYIESGMNIAYLSDVRKTFEKVIS